MWALNPRYSTGLSDKDLKCDCILGSVTVLLAKWTVQKMSTFIFECEILIINTNVNNRPLFIAIVSLFVTEGSTARRNTY